MYEVYQDHPKQARLNIRVVLAVAFLVCAIGAGIFLITRLVSKPLTKEDARGQTGIVYDSSAVEGGWDNLSPEEIAEKLNEKVAEGMINISMNTAPYFENGKAEGNVMIVNESINNYPQQVEFIRNDTGEQNHGSTVADTVFTDPIAEPHNQHGAGYEAANDDDRSKDAVTAGCILDCRHLVLQCQVISKGHKDGQSKGNNRRDLVEGFSALFALALQPLQRRQRIGQKLDDDGGVDVRRNRQGKNCCLGQGAARQDVQVFQEVSACCRTAHPRSDELVIQERDSDGTAHSENDNDK